MRSELKLAILESGRAAYELASAIGISESRLSRIVTGRIVPTPAEKRAIAAALGVGEDLLFGDEG